MNYFHQEIESIRHRPTLHLGRISITALYDYLNGFQSAMYVFGMGSIKKLLPLPFCFFDDYVANYYHWNESTAGWRNIILKETQSDEEESFRTFFALYDGFRALTMQQCCKAILSDENIRYHYTSEFAPKRMLPPNYEKAEPIFDNPIEVYMLELTHGAGYLCMVNTASQHRLERRIYKSKDLIESYMRQCFGASLVWECIEIDNIEFCKELQS